MTYNRTHDTEARLEKLRKKLQDEADDLDALDVAALRARIVECQTNLVETAREMDADTGLRAARTRLEAVLGPYKEAKTRLTSVAQYCALRLEQQG
jgi:hypothetical protein